MAASTSRISHVSWPDALISNLRLLGFQPSPGDPDLTPALFRRPNKRSFQRILLFLFEALDRAEAASRFDLCRRCLNRRQEDNFARAACAWLSELAADNRLPRLTPSMAACPQGDKIYELLAKLSTVVLRRQVIALGVPEREIARPPVAAYKGPLAARRSALARSCAVAAIAEERQALLKRLGELEEEESRRRAAMDRLCSRYRVAADEEAVLTARLAGGVGAMDEERLAQLEALWMRLSEAVEAVEVGGVRATGGVELDGGRLRAAGKEKVDVAAMVKEARRGAEEVKRRGGTSVDAEVERKAKETLSCLRRQVGQLEKLVDRASSSLPAHRMATTQLRQSDGLRLTSSPLPRLPTLNGQHSPSPVAASPRFLPPPRSALSLDHSWDSSTEQRPVRESAQSASSPDPTLLIHRLQSARRLPTAAEERRTASPMSGGSRSDASAHVSFEADEEQFVRSLRPTSPKVELRSRFRLSLDRLGLEESDEDWEGGLVEETSSLLLSSSTGDVEELNSL